jgi:hypothetical protein
MRLDNFSKTKARGLKSLSPVQGVMTRNDLSTYANDISLVEDVGVI